MKRRMATVLATVALTSGALGGAAGAAMAQPQKVTVLACFLGGGVPLPTGENDSLVCNGGEHDGAPVEMPEQPSA
ncbi:hypothetical protein LZG04_16190 [Saccharothrix sp. S26]|uniref:hypothetical protein n=1 Tax=Saccharothrix sp. S26 TaxID=2907215 RepID=UPI001F23236F|nr:hypothetical protein [Saccharothrix sp. S26]MCE6996325.1 hypothetical protein [Saccharothrix sp. S26]